ncbi:MAG: TRAFs-binding domain-containing protein [Ginsengibacter sp.]
MADELTCFVVMGFGKKTDFETGRTLDLDMSYLNMIKPAVEAAGLVCLRADEIVHSGLIDVPMYEQLLNADVVVADLSTSNKNAFYELGIRHALRPFTTIIICEDGMKSPMPFDVNHVAVRQYHHLGEDIGSSEARRFSSLLTDAIKNILNKHPHDQDSPVYTFINGLKAPEIAAAIKEAVQPASSITKSAVGKVPSNLPTHSELMRDVDEAQKEGDWLTAKVFLTKIRKNAGFDKPDKEDAYILQRLALATYKAKSPNEIDSLREADGIIELLEPATSNDPETLGLWGAVHKRLWELTHDISHLDKAVNAYERGFYIRNDYYNGINYAFLLNVRAAQATDTGESIADFIQARRVRKVVLDICNAWLAANPKPAEEDAQADNGYSKSAYWVNSTIAEAYVGLEDVNAAEKLQQLYSSVPEKWMQDSTGQQIKKLQVLLSKSPLQLIKEK